MARLHELGLTVEVLQEAVRIGRANALSCTPHDTAGAHGYLMWNKTIRALRDALKPAGWQTARPKNLELVVHPDGLLAITVAAGDSRTGFRDQTPATRTEKGQATKDAVAFNQFTFVDISRDFPRPADAPLQPTYFLLHYSDERAEELRLELSRPDEMNQENVLVGWDERIILPTISFGSARRLDSDENDDDQDYEVPVAKRG